MKKFGLLLSVLMLVSCAPTPTPTPTDAPMSLMPTPIPLTAMPMLPTPTPAPPTAAPVIYVVKAGDTLSAIAKEFGVTVEALQEVNAISDPRRLQVGQELVIPQGNVVVRAMATSVLSAPTAKVPLLTSTSMPVVYVVKPGDTLSAIAKEFGGTVEALQQANNISDPRRLQIGQELIIPKGETIVPRGTSTEVKPTSTPLTLKLVPLVPTANTVTGAQPTQRTCCRICRKGKACGDSCIARNKTCHKPPGCACNGY